MHKDSDMKATIISIGDELVSGQTVDTNSAWLGRELGRRGIRVVAHRTLGDDVEQIAEAIRRAAQTTEQVLVSGGLGPTADDMTREGLAAAMGVQLVLDEESLAAIEDLFRRRGWTMAPTNRAQAMIPEGAEAIPNSRGTAPGIAATIGRARIFVTPGVPHEMREMFTREIAPRLPEGVGAIVQRVVHTFGLGESTVATRIGDLMHRDADPTVGTTVAAGIISIRVTARAGDKDAAMKRTDRVVEELHRRLGHLVIGEDDETLASVAGELLRAAGATLTVAESCTGGLLGQMVTEVPGSSEYFLGGVIAYSDRIKEQLLDVPPEILAEHGAVSEPVAAAMAMGCRKRIGGDHAISITGIAGPGGGSEAKPIGLVYVGLAGAGGVEVHRHVFSGTRAVIRIRSALAGLNYLRLSLLGAPLPDFDR